MKRNGILYQLRKQQLLQRKTTGCIIYWVLPGQASVFGVFWTNECWEAAALR